MTHTLNTHPCRQNNGFIGELFSWSANIFEWLGLKRNNYSKNVDKFTKNLTNYGTLIRMLVKNGMSGKFFNTSPARWEKKY